MNKKKPFRISADKTKLYYEGERYDFTPIDSISNQCSLCAFEEKSFIGFCEHLPCVASERIDNENGYFLKTN